MELDDTTRRPREEGDSARNSARSRGTDAGTFGRSGLPPHGRYQAPSADFIQRILAAAQQGGNRLFFCSTAWELGHDLIDRQEYALAVECFRGLLRFAERAADRFLIEASVVAERLCGVLSREEPAGVALQKVREALRQDLARLTYEDVGAAAAVLASYAGGRDFGAGQLPLALPEDEAPTSEIEGARALAVVPAAGLRGAPAIRPNAVMRDPGDHQATLQVCFFGRFELRCEGRAVPLCRNRKALAVLKYLLARRTRPVSQDYLMGWLWPESDLKRARWSLNSAIHNLRKLLHCVTPPTAPLDAIRFEQGYYCLSPEVRAFSDADEFEARYEQGRHLEKSRRRSEAAAEYERAVELYRDDYLTEDLYEDWTIPEREWLANAYIHALHRLASHYAEVGRFQDSLGNCYRLLEKDRCHEESHRLLMRCYSRLGLRDRALHQYRLCEQVLRRGYDTDPSPKTQALFKALLKGESI